MEDFSDILLTVDYDRTLTAPDSTIPQRNIEAIHYFMEHGGTFTVNTGRSIPMAQAKLLSEIPVNAPLLLYNGSGAYDRTNGKMIRYTPLGVDPMVLIPDLQEKFPQLHIEIQALDAHYLIRKDLGWEQYCQKNGCPWAYTSIEKIPQPLIKIAIYGEFRKDTVAGMYETEDWEIPLFERLLSYLSESYGDKLAVFRACPRIVDLHAKGVSKLQSARQLQADLQKKILVCVGDAENDTIMLDGADFAYCPADGIVADRYENVCKCAEGAIADVIYKKIPKILAK